MSKLRQRSIFGGLVVVLGTLLFLVASAFIVDRGSVTPSNTKATYTLFPNQ